MRTIGRIIGIILAALWAIFQVWVANRVIAIGSTRFETAVLASLSSIYAAVLIVGGGIVVLQRIENAKNDPAQPESLFSLFKDFVGPLLVGIYSGYVLVTI